MFLAGEGPPCRVWRPTVNRLCPHSSLASCRVSNKQVQGAGPLPKPPVRSLGGWSVQGEVPGSAPTHLAKLCQSLFSPALQDQETPGCCNDAAAEGWGQGAGWWLRVHGLQTARGPTCECLQFPWHCTTVPAASALLTWCVYAADHSLSSCPDTHRGGVSFP